MGHSGNRWICLARQLRLESLQCIWSAHYEIVLYVEILFWSLKIILLYFNPFVKRLERIVDIILYDVQSTTIALQKDIT